MISIVSNTSVLVPYMFPQIYREDGPNLVEFVKAYHQWQEQEGNAKYYTRRLYDIENIDKTFDQFIVYFKEKYLHGIQFNTAADIRTVIKHALDIYRSKGTQRGIQLLFQLAYGETPAFYYPASDLFYLSSGTWSRPQYLELTLNWQNNIQLEHQPIIGINSGATAFVEDVIRRKTNNKLQDIAYISGIEGQFLAGEQVQPINGSLPIANCPFLTGSLNSIILNPQTPGQDYTFGSYIPISTENGDYGIVQISNTVNEAGFVSMNFVDGGWGYWLNSASISINYVAAHGSFQNNQNIYAYSNNQVIGTAVINSVTATNSSAGTLTANILNGVFSQSQFFSYGNVNFANIASQNTSYSGPTLYLSNATLQIANLTTLTSNLEYVHYFQFLETLSEPMATINYISANGSLLAGMNVYTYYGNNVVMGQGIIIDAAAANSSAGTLVISVYSGSMDNTFYSYANAVIANLAASNGYSNTTATAQFIANSSQITLNIANVAGNFVVGEEIFCQNPLTGPESYQKIEGWGTLYLLTANSMTINAVSGIFLSNNYIIGLASNATANIVNVTISLGVVNISSNSFVASPYALIQSSETQGFLNEAVLSGSGFSLTIANSLLYTAQANLNTDTMDTYANVSMNATAYGFPALPAANASSGSMQAVLNFANATIGKLANVFVAGEGLNYNEVPFAVIDEPLVSGLASYNAIINILNPSDTYIIGEEVVQYYEGTAENIYGTVLSANTTVVSLLRLSANNFSNTYPYPSYLVGTSSSANAQITSVDYDYMSAISGRNAIVEPFLITGNNIPTEVTVIDSGFGFINGETVAIGSNGATGTIITAEQGRAAGYYSNNGGFLSANKKLFDGYFYQHFSYQIISPIMIQSYYQMMQDIMHVSGTLMFGNFVHNSYNKSSALDIQQSVVNIVIVKISPTVEMGYYYYYLGI